MAITIMLTYMSITTVPSPSGWVKDINVQYWVRYQNSRETQVLRSCLLHGIFCLAVDDALFTTHHAARISLSLIPRCLYLLLVD